VENSADTEMLTAELMDISTTRTFSRCIFLIVHEVYGIFRSVIFRKLRRMALPVPPPFFCRQRKRADKRFL
jgi:hypothetical protein